MIHFAPIRKNTALRFLWHLQSIKQLFFCDQYWFPVPYQMEVTIVREMCLTKVLGLTKLLQVAVTLWHPSFHIFHVNFNWNLWNYHFGKILKYIDIIDN